MNKEPSSFKIAILAADGFELSELVEPRKALQAIDIKTYIVSPENKEVRGWQNENWAEAFAIDIPLTQADPSVFDMLLLPGGVMNPDKLRITPGAIEFIKHFVQENKLIAAICHGPWTLINAQAVKGKTVTSWPSLMIDMKNAGANWIDREVVIDDKLITSRKPSDIPFFNKAIIDALLS